MRRVPMLLLLLSVFHLGFSFRSVAQDSHTQKLIDGAKKEGALVWYMSASIEDAKAILRYTADWPEVTFDLFPVVPSETGWETYAPGKVEPMVQA